MANPILYRYAHIIAQIKLFFTCFLHQTLLALRNLMRIILLTIKIIIMLPIVAYGIAAFTGIGVTELVEKIFVRRETPQQAIAGINIPRLLITAIIIGGAIFFINRKLFKR